MYKTSQYFLKPYESSSENKKFELNLSNYATKPNLKGVTSVDASNFAAKSDLASLKAQF